MIFALFARNRANRLASGRRAFRASDGRTWQVEVRVPGSSNAMVVFLHPSAGSTQHNRYAWHITDGPESRDVKARLAPQQVLDGLDDAGLQRLFRRSMPVSSQVPRLEPTVGSRSNSAALDLARAEDDASGVGPILDGEA